MGYVYFVCKYILGGHQKQYTVKRPYFDTFFSENSVFLLNIRR